MTASSVRQARPHQRIALANTFTKSVVDRTPMALIVGALLGFMGVVLGPLFEPIQGTIGEMMALMPKELLALIGNVDMATPQGWFGGEMYSTLAPAAIIYVGIASASKALAGEMEAGSIGLLAANPVSRTRLATSKALAMLVHVALAALLTGAGVWLGITIAELPVESGNVLAMSTHLALLGTATGALAMLISVVTGRRMLGLLLAALVAFVAYVLASFLPLSDTLEGLAPLSPWYHYNGSDPLANGLELFSSAVLAALTAILLWASIVAFERRDLPG